MLEEINVAAVRSGPDQHVGARLLLYNAAFHLKFTVPVRSVLVLLRPKAETPGLGGRLSYVSGGKRVIFEFEVIRLWKQPVELFLESGPGLLPLAPLCRLPTGKPTVQALREVVREIDRRLASISDHAKAVRLMTGAFILTGMRVPKASLSTIYEGVRLMHETTAFDELEERIAKFGHDVLLKLGRQRFGNPPPRIEKAIVAIGDPDRLQRMFDVILEVKSWKALLEVQ